LINQAAGHPHRRGDLFLTQDRRQLRSNLVHDLAPPPVFRDVILQDHDSPLRDTIPSNPSPLSLAGVYVFRVGLPWSNPQAQAQGIEQV